MPGSVEQEGLMADSSREVIDFFAHAGAAYPGECHGASECLAHGVSVIF
jgi:hypothetical protein